MSHEFKPGDTVALKSGGAAMTVADFVTGKPNLYCIWIDETGKQWDGQIRPSCLSPIIRRAIHIDEATIRHVWVFADSERPIADHIAMRLERVVAN